MDHSEDRRIDRRTALQWISTATASLPFLEADGTGDGPIRGYGPDPDLLRTYRPGDLWPLTFSREQRKLVTVISDIIIPADDTSPGASAVGVPDFLDEWISSPYPGQKMDRTLMLKGLDWLDAEAGERGSPGFVDLPPAERLRICEELSIAAKEDRRQFPGSFFLRLRDLVAGGYYTTPEGMRDIGYRGNVPMTEWNGPPPEVLERLGLGPEDVI